MQLLLKHVFKFPFFGDLVDTDSKVLVQIKFNLPESPFEFVVDSDHQIRNLNSLQYNGQVQE